MIIYCCNCKRDIHAELVSGLIIYPHREDLKTVPFWRCNNCRGYVGCHYKTKDHTRPLGVIPSYPVQQMRKKIHSIIDPLWKNGIMPRQKIYDRISARLGKRFHTAEIRSIEEGNTVIEIIKQIKEIL